LSSSVNHLLDEIFSEKDPSTAILKRFKNGEKLPGFQSGLHKEQDPRTSHLPAALNRLPVDEEFERLSIAIKTANDLSEVKPHVILVIAFVERKLGNNSYAFNLCVLARIVGWVAHAAEQYHEHKMIRPKADYIGELPENTPKN
jgi:citrate synthase